MRRIAVGILSLACASTSADVFRYEADAYPQDAEWIAEEIYCNPQLSLDNGWFVAELEMCPGENHGRTAAYRRYLLDFIGAPAFWAEWRVVSDAPRSEIPFGGGASVGIGGLVGINYSFFISEDLAKLNRDNFLPIIFVDIGPGVPHLYRLELHGAERYIWYIDGIVVDSGVPEGAFPSAGQDSIVWVSMSRRTPNTTRWDYFRYGDLVVAERGDANCDGVVNSFDIDPFVEALVDLRTYTANHPDCSLLASDLNVDGQINTFDIDPFVACLVGGGCE